MSTFFWDFMHCRQWYFATDVLGQPISWPLKMGLIGCPLLLLTNYDSVLCKTSQNCWSHLLHGRSLKSCIKFLFKHFSQSSSHFCFMSQHSPKHPVLKSPIFFPCNKTLNFTSTYNNRQTYSLRKAGKKRFLNLFCSYIL